jgi:hypothetical protein
MPLSNNLYATQNKDILHHCKVYPLAAKGAHVREYLSVGLGTLRAELRVKKCKKYRYKRNVSSYSSLSYQSFHFFLLYHLILSYVSSLSILKIFASTFFYLTSFPPSLILQLSLSFNNCNFSLPFEVLQFPYTGTVSVSFSCSLCNPFFSFVHYFPS